MGKRTGKRKAKAQAKTLKPQLVKEEITTDTIIAAVQEATENMKNPPKFLMEKLKNMENQLNILNTSVVSLQKENDHLKIEVLKHLDYSGGINMKILELLTLQNNNFQSRLNQVYTPTARRNTPFVIQGTPTFSNTAVEL